ncbi:MAG TPA: cation:proton antiporter [Flavobacterium sp.]|jgi:NhaP-type Na+/H+ or K+/H+ antiporter
MTYDFAQIDPYHLQMILWGFITLLAATIPNILKSRNITAPIVYLIIGIVIYLATNNYSTIAGLDNVMTIRKICEFVVLVALVNAGLKIRKPFQWSTWKYSFWLLIVTMPLTILAVAWAGAEFLGLAPAAALLLGALISPTDPVLAADLQTSPPSEKDISNTRLALTSEAGINDGLAFPFVYFALYMATEKGDYSDWLQHWILVDVFYKISMGCAMGLVTGWLLHNLIYKMTSRNQHSQISRGILALSLTLLPYALTEIVGAYGFIAVFVAACVFSNSEKIIEHMDSLHDFTEEIEGIFVALLFVIIGIYLCENYEALMDWRLILFALLIIIIIRPVFGWLALCRSDLSNFEKLVVSFYGIRGVGSIFYLMYALSEVKFPDAEKLIQVTAVTITLSVFIHGLSAAAIQKKLDQFDSQ